MVNVKANVAEKTSERFETIEDTLLAELAVGRGKYKKAKHDKNNPNKKKK